MSGIATSDATTTGVMLSVAGDADVTMVDFAALVAFFDGRVAVEFTDVVGENSGLEVKSIDILRDDATKFAAILKLDDREMAEVGFCEVERDGLEFVLATLCSKCPEAGGGAIVADVAGG